MKNLLLLTISLLTVSCSHTTTRLPSSQLDNEAKKEVPCGRTNSLKPGHTDLSRCSKYFTREELFKKQPIAKLRVIFNSSLKIDPLYEDLILEYFGYQPSDLKENYWMKTNVPKLKAINVIEVAKLLYSKKLVFVDKNHPSYITKSQIIKFSEYKEPQKFHKIEYSLLDELDSSLKSAGIEYQIFIKPLSKKTKFKCSASNPLYKNSPAQEVLLAVSSNNEYVEITVEGFFKKIGKRYKSQKGINYYIFNFNKGFNFIFGNPMIQFSNAYLTINKNKEKLTFVGIDGPENEVSVPFKVCTSNEEQPK